MYDEHQSQNPVSLLSKERIGRHELSETGRPKDRVTSKTQILSWTMEQICCGGITGCGVPVISDTIFANRLVRAAAL